MSMANFDIVEIKELSGKGAHIYTIRIQGASRTLLDEFFEENRDYADELRHIANRLNVMGHDTGCRWDFFKHYEGKPGDGVSALAVKKGRLRLYCMYFNDVMVILGSGGYKSSNTRSYQETPALDAKVKQMGDIASEINMMRSRDEFKIDTDGHIILEENEED